MVNNIRELILGNEMLKIYNSLHREKQIFQPIDPQRVRLYVCGMTVYDYCHVGHARVLVVFDIVYRYLCKLYGETHVEYVRNITDIDDKIIKRAQENNEPMDALTARYIAEMHQDAASLNILPPTQEPRATTHLTQIIAMVQRLVDNGVAYAADNGDVYYSVSAFANYGKLSGRNLAEERSGARVEVDEAKKDPMDFVLWKASKPDEPAWDSPWGAGRPGWHIECSAMSTYCLGNHFDIHGGGMDLKFPHHENEIAQSEAATNETFVNTWMHNGHVMIDQEKMSKSLGNFFTVREVLKQFSPEVLRYFIVTSHYRSPLNYSDENLIHAKAALERFYTALRDIPVTESVDPNTQQTKPFAERFDAAMADDFNTPEAIAVLFDVAKALNRAKADDTLDLAIPLAKLLKNLGGQLGLLQDAPDRFLQGVNPAEEAGLNEQAIEDFIQQRLQARANKDWAEADRVRDGLKAQGILLEDGPQGTTWRRE